MYDHPTKYLLGPSILRGRKGQCLGYWKTGSGASILKNSEKCWVTTGSTENHKIIAEMMIDPSLCFGK
ncbi:hypothetical protein TNCV_3480871 [Trichonephila clavipes]|nr:hypothetical protein TNCV_3480871 [Trichonephila clavipes]